MHAAGRMYIWNGGSLLIGRASGPTGLHAHHAVVLSFTFGSAMRFSSKAREWTEHRGVVIEPDYPHAFDGLGQESAHFFIEPESRDGRAIMARLGGPGIVAIDPTQVAEAVPILRGPWATNRDDADAIRAAGQLVIRHFAGSVERASPVDERVTSALDYIKAHIGRTITLAEVAAAVNLSPSRFRHLLVEQTGMGLRPYILWLRLQRAWELVAAGHNLTSAAHGAGFADSAHLTRTSRRMFGIPPIALTLESVS